MTDYTSLVTALRTNESRDNRTLLDDAADAIDRLQRERDAAVNDFSKVIGDCPCNICVHGVANNPTLEEVMCNCPTCYELSGYDNFEWRGIDGTIH